MEQRFNHIQDTPGVHSLSERDAWIFLSILDDDQPNQALRDAAAWYKQTYGDSLTD